MSSLERQVDGYPEDGNRITVEDYLGSRCAFNFDSL